MARSPEAALLESRPKHSARELRLWLRCDPEHGLIYYRKMPLSDFRCRTSWARWNGKNADTEAFGSTGADGYKRGTLMGSAYLAHRVLWALVYGDWPADDVDHINGVRNDNRISNLRAVVRQENCRNARIPRHNTSGAIGVYWAQDRRKWVAQIKVDGAVHYLGRFVEFDDALRARKAAEQRYNFHPNHGRVG
jgi:hypothetical protein